MSSLFDTRRYLTDFDSRRVGHVVTDVLVVGSGVAGARAALAASEHGLVTILCKREFAESATRYAQGGIAVALGVDDSPQSHFEDTMRVGCGLNRREAVRLLVDQSRQRVEEVMSWGFAADREGDRVALGREGGQSTNRIVHALGDQTGRELVRVLERRVRETPRVRVFEHCFLLDFLTLDGVCFGAVTFHEKYGHQFVWAKRTILATGGCGQLWRETTNPAIATGDGVAAAFRAGARLADMEMMQFHPTTLYIAGAGRALISEAVRGEGARLVDKSGHRFMADCHPEGELAPRDVVSRAIHSHLSATRSNCVYLDVRHIAGFGKRFPGISKLCAEFQIDVTRDLIPVRPSAHYMIGGVEVGLDGRSNIEGLLACGEAACTGVHGANRMASNSLLEGLVFGAVAGESAGRALDGAISGVPLHRVVSSNARTGRTELDLVDIRNSLRSLVWRNVGITRDASHLRETCEILDFWGHYTLDKTFDDMHGWELQNLLTIGKLVTSAALARPESIGVHFRSDAPPPNEVNEGPYRLTLARDEQGTRPARGETRVE